MRSAVDITRMTQKTVDDQRAVVSISRGQIILNIAIEKTNLCSLFLLLTNSLICKRPVMRKRARKTTDTGTSGIGVGGVPRLCV